MCQKIIKGKQTVRNPNISEYQGKSIEISGQLKGKS